MNALLHKFGDMLSDIGVKDERGVLVLPPESDWANLKFSDVLFEQGKPNERLHAIHCKACGR